MMSIFFNFGENVNGFDYKVINEREARASAGIMFLLGLLSLFSVFIFRTLLWAELFSITFIIEFLIRIVFSPKYAPYMLIGGWFVKNQTPDWVEANPKQFAWFLGLVLGAIMTFYILFDVISLIRLSICIVCLILLYLESVFGICLGCMLYKKLNIKTKNCPGGICDTTPKVKYKITNYFIVAGFIVLFYLTYISLNNWKYNDVNEIVIVKDK